MYLTSEDVAFLLGMGIWFLSIIFCLILICFPYFRRKNNALAWLVWSNLLAGMIYAAQFPAAMIQDAWFEQADPQYTVSREIAEVKSLYFPDIDSFELAAYGCFSTHSDSICSFPIGQQVTAGRLDFVETGRDPIIRYQIHHGEAACLQHKVPPNFPIVKRGPFPIEGSLGVCVLGREVETATATHEFRTEDRQQGSPSGRPYIHAELIERGSDAVLAQFDGWNGAAPYFLNHGIVEPRRPDGELGQLIRIQPDRNLGYDREKVDDLMARYGFDEEILMAAAASPYQRYQASALWLACRTQLVDSISVENREYLREMSGTVFEDDPDWIYPESCPDWAK